MENNYKHTQTGFMGIIIFGAIVLAGIYALFAYNTDWTSILGILFFILVFLINTKMTIEADQESLTFYLGLGLFRKTIERKDIANIELGDPMPPFNSGLRPTFSGLVYNVSGTDSIKIT